MKRYLSVFIAVLCTFSATLAQTSPEFVSGKVEFRIKNMGLNVNGTMTGVSMQFKQPSVDPATWNIEGTVSPATISTGINIRDRHLKRSDYFDIAQFPVSGLQSTSVIATGKNNYKGIFNLMIKGITKSVIIPFAVRKNDKLINIEGEFSINRLDYKLGEESIVLSDTVTIRIYAVFK